MGPAASDANRGVYGISVAAELTGIGPQNLRLYESRGLLQPERTEGGTRRYSEHDLTRLRRIGALLENGLNLAGVAMVLDLEHANSDLKAANAGLRNANTASRAPVPSTPTKAAATRNTRTKPAAGRTQNDKPAPVPTNLKGSSRAARTHT
jgi:DNA-binding transcriptional MerR regulator